MQNAAKVCANALNESAEKPTSANAVPELGKPRQVAMRRFWLRMIGVYGHRWSSTYGDTPEDESGALTITGDTWQRGLTGVTEPQIGEGIAACLASSDGWPPSLPEFRKRCLGIPSIAEVRRAVRPGNAAPSGFVRLIWKYIDGWAFQAAPSEKAERMVSDAYELACDHVMRGGLLPDEPLALIEHTAESPRPAESERVKHWMAQIEAALDTN